MKKGFILLLMLSLILMVSGCSIIHFYSRESTENTSTIAENNGSVTISQAEYNSLIRFKTIAEMLDTINENFYIDFNEDDLLTEAARGLMYGLNDPYSFYYSPQEYEAMWADDEGNYAGVGIQILTSADTLMCTVSRVFKDSPAQKIGVQKGDILVQVEDVVINAYTLQEGVDIMRGVVGTPVNIKVMRGEEALDFTIERAIVKVNWVEYAMLENNIGYIVLYEFSGDCKLTFAQAVDSLISQGAKGLIVDLRDNPGGWVSDAEAIADLFLDEGITYYLEYRNGNKEYVYTKAGAVDTKIVLIINENSASASEVLAGAMQDRNRATVVGTQSFGKGVVQYVLPVGNDGAGMQFTAAQYYTPNGNKVHGVGITPNIVVELPEEDQNKMFEIGDMNDFQLKTAYDFILMQ